MFLQKLSQLCNLRPQHSIYTQVLEDSYPLPGHLYSFILLSSPRIYWTIREKEHLISVCIVIQYLLPGEKLDWITVLPLAEFSYNILLYSSLIMSPFQAIYGYNLHILMSRVPASIVPWAAFSRETSCITLIKGKARFGQGCVNKCNKSSKTRLQRDYDGGFGLPPSTFLHSSCLRNQTQNLLAMSLLCIKLAQWPCAYSCL